MTNLIRTMCLHNGIKIKNEVMRTQVHGYESFVCVMGMARGETSVEIGVRDSRIGGDSNGCNNAGKKFQFTCRNTCT